MAKDNASIVSVGIMLALLLLAFLFLNSNKKAHFMSSERFQVNNASRGDPLLAGVPTTPPATSIGEIANATAQPDAAASGIGSYGASDPMYRSYNPLEAPTAPAAASASGNCFPRDRLTSDDLLPKNAANSRWAQMNPAGQGDVKDQNFLTAGYHIGIDTVGQTLRNANLQLRSEPINPQVPVSPWNISTIEPDTNRRFLEIGSE